MEFTIIVLLVSAFVVWMLLRNSGSYSQASGRPAHFNIQDKDVDMLTVLSHLEGFKPIVRPDRKNGFSEKDVHDDLEIYLKKLYHSVTREHAIEGKNVKRIDFDLGNGMV